MKSDERIMMRAPTSLKRRAQIAAEEMDLTLTEYILGLIKADLKRKGLLRDSGAK